MLELYISVLCLKNFKGLYLLIYLNLWSMSNRCTYVVKGIHERAYDVSCWKTAALHIFTFELTIDRATNSLLLIPC